MTRKTPGIFLAALVSIDLMRPCATVERKILPCSMPGSRIRCVYSARPVTFSRPSRRGTERPIWPPPIGLVGISGLLRYVGETGTVDVMRSMIADVGTHLAAKHPIRPRCVDQNHRQQEERADQQEGLGALRCGGLIEREMPRHDHRPQADGDA